MSDSQEILLSGLHPIVRDQVQKTLARLQEMNCPCVVESGYRSYEEQQKLYDLGRTTKNPDGASPAMPFGHIVTNAMPGFSFHNFGIAADLTRLDKNGNKTWDLPYAPIGEAGKQFGLEWGGDWTTFKDLPHLQNTFGYKLSQLQELVKAVGIKGLWDRIDQKGWTI